MVQSRRRKLRLMTDESHSNAERHTNTGSLPSSIRPNSVVPSSRDQLCRRCLRIDLDGVLSRKHKTYRGQYVKKLGPISQWAIGSCPLCTLLATTLPPENRRRTNAQYTLRSFSSNRSRQMGLNSIDTGMIGLDSSGICLIPQRQGDTRVRLLSPDHINFEIVKSWLSLCREMHTKDCAVKLSSPARSMKLVDCETGDIVPAANHPYLTLSYVCGADAKPVEHCGSLPKDLPATIEDSIIVTRKLGFRYLWIDQFCIDQKDNGELAEQLLTMDSIYHNSDLTIIAAAGRDATYGLPGVGKRHRTQHSYSQVGHHFFASSLNDPRYVIESSAWTTRAWTHQEEILSRRRLVFTDEQVYYECYGMYCCEVFDSPLRDMHTQSQQRLKMGFCNGANIGIFPRGVGHGPWEVLRRIEEYSAKSLTNPSDILNAVLGILRAFEDGPFQIRHCLGVPILPRPRRRARPPSESDETSTWDPVSGLFMGLCWQPTIPTSRRVGLPSWSWTGWSAPVNWATDDLEILQTDPNINIGFELNDVFVKYDLFQDCYIELDRSLALSKYIHISAWTSVIRVLRYDTSRRKYVARIDLEDGDYLHWRFRPTTKTELSIQLSYVGIHMGHHDIESADRVMCQTGPALMVVARFETGLERVAFDWVDQSNSSFFRADGTECRSDAVFVTPLYERRPKLVKSWQQIRLG